MESGGTSRKITRELEPDIASDRDPGSGPGDNGGGVPPVPERTDDGVAKTWFITGTSKGFGRE